MKALLQILSVLSFIIALIYTATVKEGTPMIEYSYRVETEIRTDTMKVEYKPTRGFNVVFRPFKPIKGETDNELRHDKDVEEIRLAMYGHRLQNVRTITIGGESKTHIFMNILLTVLITILLFIGSLMTNNWTIQADNY